MRVLRLPVTLLIGLLLTSCMQVRSTFIQISREPSPSEGTSSALREMELAFKGDHHQQEIQRKLDESFALYGLEPTEENYRMAKDVLVALSTSAEAQGCPICIEIAILDHLIESGTRPGVDWQEAAALSSAELVAQGEGP